MYKVHVTRTIIMALVGLAVGVTIKIVSRPIYEGRVEMLLGTPIDTQRSASTMTEDVREIIQRSRPSTLLTERQLLNSEAVFYEALRVVSEEEGDRSLLDDWEHYYKMFDVISARSSNQVEQGAGIVQLQVRMHDPLLAAKMANAVAESYNDTRRRAAGEAVSQAISYLQAKIEATSDELTDAEAAFAEYKSSIGVAEMAKKNSVVEDLAASIESSMDTSQATMEGYDAKIESLIFQIDQLPDEMYDPGFDVERPLIGTYEAQLAGLMQQRVFLLSRYTATNPKVQENDDAITDIQGRLDAAKAQDWTDQYRKGRKNPQKQVLEQELALSLAARAQTTGRRAMLEKLLGERNEEIVLMPDKQVHLMKLQRDLLIFDGSYSRLKVQLEDLRNRRETGPKAAVVLRQANVTREVADQTDPVAPDLLKLTFIGFIAGASIGLIASFALESMRPRIYTSTQLADLTGLTVVASTPALSGTSRSSFVKALDGGSAQPAESFRNMAFGYLAKSTGECRTILFTGIGTSGSSAVGAVQFAITLAHSGKRVLLVDAERTRQILTIGFDAADSNGISDALGGGDPAGMITDTRIENLRLLPIGVSTDRFIDAGMSSLERVLDAIKADADYVIISVAPADTLADASAFASLVDEVCLSVSARTNEFSSVPIAFDILEQAGAKSVKLILSDAAKDSEPFTRTTAIRRQD
ncbi:MAG: hypothetical protein IH944_03715 [Armatimonadetes bacterium]|nr:hypothetical protein [Armatimonadota bacterium]